MESPPAGHAAAVAHLLGQLFPGNTGTQDKDDAIEDMFVIDAGPATLRGGFYFRQQELEALPERGASLYGASCGYRDMKPRALKPRFVSRS